jgi:hypothetical protein
LHGDHSSRSRFFNWSFLETDKSKNKSNLPQIMYMSLSSTRASAQLPTGTLSTFSLLKPATHFVSVNTGEFRGDYSVDPAAGTEQASIENYGDGGTVRDYSNSFDATLGPASQDESQGTPYTPIIVPIAQDTSPNLANAVGKRHQQPDRLEAAPGAPTVDGEGQDTVNKDEPVQHGEGVEEGDKLKTVDRTGAQLVAAIAVVGFAHLLL